MVLSKTNPFLQIGRREILSVKLPRARERLTLSPDLCRCQTLVGTTRTRPAPGSTTTCHVDVFILQTRDRGIFFLLLRPILKTTSIPVSRRSIIARHGMFSMFQNQFRYLTWHQVIDALMALKDRFNLNVYLKMFLFCLINFSKVALKILFCFVFFLYLLCKQKRRTLKRKYNSYKLFTLCEPKIWEKNPKIKEFTIIKKSYIYIDLVITATMHSIYKTEKLKSI